MAVQLEMDRQRSPGAAAICGEVDYRLAVPSAMLGVPSLEAALALVGDEYRTAAPVLQALATHVILARTYLVSRGL